MNIDIPTWFDELSVKHYDVHYQEEGESKIKTFTDKDQSVEFARSMGVEDYFPFPYNYGRPYHHRRMSNNSIGFIKKPNRQFLSFVFTMLRGEGEPAFVNLEEGARRILKALGVKKPSKDQLEFVMVLIGLNPLTSTGGFKTM